MKDRKEGRKKLIKKEPKKDTKGTHERSKERNPKDTRTIEKHKVRKPYRNNQ